MAERRLYLFRGKCAGVWRKGSLIMYSDASVIKAWRGGFSFEYTVDMDSVGQCTGFKDIDGKEIFEGDIIKIATNSSLILRVAWGDGKYELRRPDGHISTEPCDSFFAKNWKVIGNIHDNPELLKERFDQKND